MSEGRERVLGRLRAALRRAGPVDGATEAALEARARGGRPLVQPDLRRGGPGSEGADLVAIFMTKVTSAAGTLERVPSVAAVSDAVRGYLEREGLEPALVSGSDPLLEQVRWPNQIAVARRAAVDADRVSLTSAFAGIAETGTVVLLSAPESPTSLNFLPEHHLVLLARERIVAHLEDVWSRLRRERRALPRAVNLITGPSRTADVEMNLEFGAHGPRRLHVLLLD